MGISSFGKDHKLMLKIPTADPEGPPLVICLLSFSLGDRFFLLLWIFNKVQENINAQFSLEIT